ncbi:hypothetical protein RhiirA1_402552 [Rhizophagus irregularis]|uniref:Uncharacterized protein n=3 Tax=Rhizophagus irregularis TaxID=588596 RepID=A0A2I1F333_9GLOM|nr:hypothetical protein RhiirA1_402552 [Rhizophagus irregularis]PKY28778.1 hypothetical protein RhiirB3_391315 [Rhizophagus irregularis]
MSNSFINNVKIFTKFNSNKTIVFCKRINSSFNCIPIFEDEIGQMVGLDIDIRNPSIEAIGLGFDIHNPSAKNQMIIGLKFDIRNPLAGDKMIAGPDFDIHNPSADQMMVGLGLDIHNPSVEG